MSEEIGHDGIPHLNLGKYAQKFASDSDTEYYVFVEKPGIGTNISDNNIYVRAVRTFKFQDGENIQELFVNRDALVGKTSDARFKDLLAKYSEGMQDYPKEAGYNVNEFENEMTQTFFSDVAKLSGADKKAYDEVVRYVKGVSYK
jgi:hypothetical protein